MNSISMSPSLPARRQWSAGEVHRLLRRAGAFDRHRRLREDRAPALRLLHQLPGVGREVIAVVRGDAVAAERFGRPSIASQSSLMPGQTIRRPYLTTRQPSRITASFCRLEGGDGGLDPLDARAGSGCPSCARCPSRIEDAGADHGPAGLVVVDVGRVDDGDVEIRRAARSEAAATAMPAAPPPTMTTSWRTSPTIGRRCGRHWRCAGRRRSCRSPPPWSGAGCPAAGAGPPRTATRAWPSACRCGNRRAPGLAVRQAPRRKPAASASLTLPETTGR